VRVCLAVCDLETSKMRRPMPELGCCATEKNMGGECSSTPLIYSKMHNNSTRRNFRYDANLTKYNKYNFHS